MYINPDLTVMTKTTRMWEKTTTGEMEQQSEQLEPIPAEIPLLDLPNVDLQTTELRDSCTYNIAYFSILFHILYRTFNASCSKI